MKSFPGISRDPNVRFGKPCVAGTRIDVRMIVGAMAAGDSLQTVAEHTALRVEQVREALRFAAHLAGHPPSFSQLSP
jgi:uncharacterized protein (DUF433 family)